MKAKRPTNPPSFLAWMKKQTSRPGCVGEVACYIIRKIPKKPRNGYLNDWRDCLRQNEAPSYMLDWLVVAWDEYCAALRART